MKIIGELLNSTRQIIKEKIINKDSEYIKDIALRQKEKGADYIDVNAGEFSNKETEYLQWLVEKVKEAVRIPISLDSANPESLVSILESYDDHFLINSISAESKKYNELIDPIKHFDTEVIALCMDDKGIPCKAEEKISLADKLIDKLASEGIKIDKIYIDPLIQPVSVQPDSSREVLKTIEKIHDWNSGVNIICGLSNISYGLPRRKLLNQAFLIMCLSRGLNSVIADPLDEYMMSLLKAAEVLMGKDRQGLNYIKAARSDDLV